MIPHFMILCTLMRRNKKRYAPARREGTTLQPNIHMVVVLASSTSGDL
jgi:hypothetical protein